MQRLLGYTRHCLITLGIVAGMLCLPLLTYQPVLAANQAVTPEGLTVSPDINYLGVNAGQPVSSDFHITNNTSRILVVNLSVQKFTVSSYIYTYQFVPSNNNWVNLNQSQLVLEPGQGQAVDYLISTPKGSRPGSSYYSLFASASGLGGSIHNTIQAASLLFLTVNGKLTYSGKLFDPSIQRFEFGSQISYTFNMVDTGNEYYFINTLGVLHGLTASKSSVSVSHLVLPAKILSVSGVITHPILPGVYRAEFGYKPSSGSRIEVQKLIIYIPPWFIALVLIVLLAGNIIYLKKRRLTKVQPKK